MVFDPNETLKIAFLLASKFESLITVDH